MAQGWGITELMARLIRFLLINWPVYFPSVPKSFNCKSSHASLAVQAQTTAPLVGL